MIGATARLRAEYLSRSAVDRHDRCQYCELPRAPARKLTTINALRGFLALPIPIIAKSVPSFSRSKRPMAIAAIHVVPDESFDDGVVRDDSGYERGHHPTRESAELAGQAIAQKLRGQLVVYPLAEQTSRTNLI